MAGAVEMDEGGMLGGGEEGFLVAQILPVLGPIEDEGRTRVCAQQGVKIAAGQLLDLDRAGLVLAAAEGVHHAATDNRDDAIRGLDSGANDYVTKPFKFAVLLARIRAQLRSHEQSEGAVFHLGAYEFRPSAKMLVDANQKKIRLTEKETNILKYLYRAGEKPVSREELLAEVWGYNAGVTTHTLETHVYRLRQKIEPDPGNARLLLTEAGGYRLAP